MADPVIEVVFRTNDGGAVVSLTLGGFNAGDTFKSDVLYTATLPNGSVQRTGSSGEGTVDDSGNAVAYALLPTDGGVIDVRFFGVVSSLHQVVRF